MLQQTWEYRYLCKTLILILWDKYPELWLLYHRLVPFIIFCRTSILFSALAPPIYIPTNNVPDFQFLHILTSTSLLFCFVFITMILRSVTWYLLVVFICFSLVMSDSHFDLRLTYWQTVGLSLCLLIHQQLWATAPTSAVLVLPTPHISERQRHCTSEYTLLHL